jgi:pimeloyl-ACP methyl ester carboxylesterase
VQVHVRDEGWAQDPVPVLLIHGTSSSLHTWERWAKDLKKDHRVISFDLPGFGLTGPAPDNDYSIAAYLRFVQSLMDTLGVKKAIIAGNSLGGEIAWRFAADMPQRVEKLILLDASGYDFKPQSVPVGFQIARIPILAWPMDFLLPKARWKTVCVMSMAILKKSRRN